MTSESVLILICRLLSLTYKSKQTFEESEPVLTLYNLYTAKDRGRLVAVLSLVLAKTQG